MRLDVNCGYLLAVVSIFFEGHYSHMIGVCNLYVFFVIAGCVVSWHK